METYGTITPKFQLHIPVKIRQKAGMTKHGMVKMTAQNKRIVITPVENDILSLAGKYKNKIKNPIPVEKIRDYIDYSDL
jgi:bifunctional DNA-binding transcriptional regulator/antitoxin component of YhaV-PrlF toxin-antitoxin module